MEQSSTPGTTPTTAALSSADHSAASARSLAIAGRMLAIFEGTFDQYQQHQLNSSASVNSTQQSNSAGNIVHQLRLLRQTVQHYLPVIVELFRETMKAGPNLVRLNSGTAAAAAVAAVAPGPDPKPLPSSVDFLCFGDLHGSLTDLLYLRELYWKNETAMQKYHFVFMGDYVDRGIHGFEIATYLILLKLVHPTHFTVLRGNHEVAWMNRSFFLEECRLKFGRQVGQHVWRLLNAAFCQLPYAALINGAVFVVHGGIPKNLRSLADLDQEIPKGLIDEHYNRLALQLLWNDFRTADYDRRRLFVAGDVEQMEATAKEVIGLPNNGTLKTNGQGTEEEEDEASIERYFVPNSVRNIGFIAGHKAVRHFLRRHDLSYIVRAHQYDGTVKATGYNTHSAKKVLTVFSNSAYVGQLNSTACVCVNSATHSIDIIGLRSGRRNPRREVGGRNHSEIFECDELAEMKFGF